MKDRRAISISGLAVCAFLMAGPLQAAPKNCQANYTLDNAGKITTGWTDLGTVGGTLVNKKNQCRKLAKETCRIPKDKLLVYAPVGSPNFNAICSTGGINVYFDSKVDGKVNSKDGSCRMPVACLSRVDCKCPAGYWQEHNKHCVTKACQPVNPKPANNTSFIDTGFFFWEGELRYRINASCTTQWIGYP